MVFDFKDKLILNEDDLEYIVDYVADMYDFDRAFENAWEMIQECCDFQTSIIYYYYYDELKDIVRKQLENRKEN